MTGQRIFIVGTTRIVEDEQLRGLSLEQVKALLARSYPEVATASLRQTTGEDGTLYVSFLPVAGKKG